MNLELEKPSVLLLTRGDTNIPRQVPDQHGVNDSPIRILGEDDAETCLAIQNV
jgi:hypothetical protein